jgi:hypothetical protein
MPPRSAPTDAPSNGDQGETASLAHLSIGPVPGGARDALGLTERIESHRAATAAARTDHARAQRALVSSRDLALSHLLGDQRFAAPPRNVSTARLTI